VPCWPDVWNHIKLELPQVAFFASAIGYLALMVLLLWAPKLRRRWLRITSRVLGVVATVPLIVLGPAFLLGLMLASGNPPTVNRTVRSQSGQEARVSYNAGFLGRDYTEVTLKSPSCCRHTRIFWHAGPSFSEDVKVDWVDSQHLHLTYHARSTDPIHCEQRYGEITIECTTLGWPSSQ
jgi:hypothetical protein